MSIDTEKLRRESNMALYNDARRALLECCDEIDRLREDIAEFSRSNDIITKRFMEGQKELATLRDQIRPRSIKDEPPPIGKWIFAWPHPVGNVREDVWIMVRYQNQGQLDDTRFTHWIEALAPHPRQTSLRSGG